MNTFEHRIEQLSEPLQRQLQARARLRLEQLGEQQPAARQQINGNHHQLIAYYTIVRSGAAPDGTDDAISEIEGLDGADLQAYAQQQLPDHMVPGRWVALGRLPRLPNGKVSMTELPKPSDASHNCKAHSTATNTDTGNDATATFDVLRGILAELLAMDDIRPDDNFFELGGDSITAIQFVSRARLAEIHLDVASVVKAASLQAIATAADSAKTDEFDDANSPDSGAQQQSVKQSNANVNSAAITANAPELGIDQQELDDFLDSLD